MSEAAYQMCMYANKKNCLFFSVCREIDVYTCNAGPNIPEMTFLCLGVKIYIFRKVILCNSTVINYPHYG